MTSRTQLLKCQIHQCGSCKKSLDSAPASASIGTGDAHVNANANANANPSPACPQHVIVTCENFKENPESCSGFTHGKNSPHYHLGCTGIPNASRLYSKLLKKATEENKEKEEDTATTVAVKNENDSDDVINDFFCRSCDIEGSSRYLMEYFINFHDIKVAYYGDEECVDVIAPVGFDDLYKKQESELNSLQSNNKDMGCGFVKYLIQREQQTSRPLVGEQFKKSELRLDLIQDIVQRVHQGYQESANIHHCIPPDESFLVGQSIRLYCNVDNIYHTGSPSRNLVLEYESSAIPGRIIDWRQNTEINLSRLTFPGNVTPHTKIIPRIDEEVKRLALLKPLQLDNEIGRTQYLVRFEGGVEDRKVAVHQWIYLEEHPVMVAVSLNWTNIGAYKKKKRRKGSTTDRTKFRPAQFFVRSALEMVPVPEINEKGAVGAELLEVLTIFLCREALSVIHGLKKIGSVPSWLDEEKKSDDNNIHDVTLTGRTLEECNLKGGPSTSITNYAAVDFLRPPDDFEVYLRTVDGGTDEPLVVATALACYETEAIKRVREGSKMWKAAESIT